VQRQLRRADRRFGRRRRWRLDARCRCRRLVEALQRRSLYRRAFVVPGIALTLPWGISAISGYSDVSRCNEANGPERQRRVANEAALARAEKLTNAAVLAARAGDCVTVKRLDVQVKIELPTLHETLVHDPAITRCLTTIEPPQTSYCFDERREDKTTTTCMASEAECHHALEMLPLGSATTTCGAKAPAD
jgi:hypothetical protein